MRSARSFRSLPALIAGCLVCLSTANAAPWIMRHGLTATQYQDFFDNELPAGYHPISVHANGSISDPRYTIVCVSDGIADGDWAARHGLTSAEYQDEVDTLAGEGFRVIAVDACGDYPNERYVAAWVRDGVAFADWGARHEMSGVDLGNEITNFRNAGFRMIWLSGIGTAGNPRFAAAWVRNFEGWTDSINWGQNDGEYQTLVEDLCKSGMRPLCITSYDSGANRRFASVFMRTDGPNFELQPPWLARHGLTPTEYQDLVDDLDETNYQAACSIAYGNVADPRYATAWFADRGPSSFSATGVAVPELATLDTVMQDFMTTRKVSHGALAVTKDNRLVYSRGFTYAPADEPLTQPESYFRIASVAKPITAIGIFRMIESNDLTLDDAIQDFPGLNAYAWCDPRIPPRVNVRTLLQHRSGWDNSYDPNLGDPNTVNKCAGANQGPSGYFDPMFSDFPIVNDLGVTFPVSHDDIITYTAQFDLNFSPTARYAYSNFGYSLLGRIIEEESGQTYADWIRENVLCHVGAQNMFIGATLWEGRQPGEVEYSDPMRRCSTSRFDGTSIVPWQYGGFNVENFDSHGGWVASTVDLVKIASDFADKTASCLLSEGSIDTMWAANPSNSGYGMGWQRLNESGVNCRYHNGSIPGSWAYMVRRDDGVTFAVLLNQRSADTTSPYTDDDWQIRRNINDALSAIGGVGGGGWPTHNLWNEAWKADFNCDGVVDFDDLNILLALYGVTDASPLYDRCIDIDKDGVIGFDDLNFMLSVYGETY